MPLAHRVRAGRITLRPLLITVIIGGTLAADPVTSPQATSILSKAVTALQGSGALADLTIDGNVSYVAGSDHQTGLGTFKAKGNRASRVDLLLTEGARQEIRNQFAGVWSGLDQQQHPMASHNLATAAVWFSPHFLASSALTQAGYSVSYIGQETRGGSAVNHLRIEGAPGFPIPELIPTLGVTEVYLDKETSLPVSIAFKLHPDWDALRDLSVEIEYSDYQASSGVMIPRHIVKVFQGSLLLDVKVTSVQVNSGLPDSEFAFQQ